MSADNMRSLGLLLAASFAITACGGSSLKTSKTKDSGTTSPDLVPERDLPSDGNPVSKDVVVDVRVATADANPDAPVLVPDSASPDTSLIGSDLGPDSPVLGRDGAGPDNTGIGRTRSASFGPLRR